MLWAAGASAASLDGQVTQADKTIVQVLEQNRDSIMAIPGVIGVGIGRCGPEICIKVIVSARAGELEQRLEALLGDCPYTIEETDPLQTLPSAREP